MPGSIKTGRREPKRCLPGDPLDALEGYGFTPGEHDLADRILRQHQMIGLSVYDAAAGDIKGPIPVSGTTGDTVELNAVRPIPGQPPAHRVVAVAGGENEQIVAVATAERVVTAAAFKDIVAGVAGKGIVIVGAL